MLVYNEADNIVSENERTSIAIGNFDGVHSGHQALLEKTIEYATQENLVSLVFTFSPHPVELINPTKKIERLSTDKEKLAIFEKLGIHKVLVQKFDYEFANISAETFFKTFLIELLQARRINVGFNFSFGKYKEGNLERLKALCLNYNIKLHVEPAHKYQNMVISSSRIRKSLLTGDLTPANAMLGYCYKLNGLVQQGSHIGQQLGFPTANIKTTSGKLVPQNGVYVTKTTVDEITYKSVTNIGIRPTITDAKAEPVVETHIIDFCENLYNKEITIEFLERIRDEIKFSSIDELVNRIKEDIEYAKKTFN